MAEAGARDFAAAVAAALERPAGGPLAGAIPAAAHTVIVVEPGDARAAVALRVAIDALVRTGHPRGRLLVLAAVRDGAASWTTAHEAVRGAAAPVPVVLHHPDRSATFRAGRAAGIDVAVDDELREAEAVVTLGAVALSPSGSRRPAEWLIVPGLAARATRDALRAAIAPARGARAHDASGVWSEAAALVHVDFEIAWWRTHGKEQVAAGVPPFAFATDDTRASRDP
jgi:hypothetical protein